MLKNTRGIGCGLVVLALIAGAFLLFGGLGGGRNNIPETGSDGQFPGSAGGEGRLGRAYVAREVDRNGCPVDSASEFFSDEIIYVGFDESVIPSGSELFARLSYEGDPVEDAPAITADRDMRTCVWFQFEPDGQGFLPGDYTAELFVNGNPVEEMGFEVVDERAGTTGGGETVQLGRVTTATQVDQSGCPVDRESSFFPDEAIYVAAMESFIPEGTEVFARLNYEGDVVEDTDPIVADRDLESCVWFVFEPGDNSQGFLPGDYTAEMYVNGNLVDEVPFQVQE